MKEIISIELLSQVLRLHNYPFDLSIDGSYLKFSHYVDYISNNPINPYQSSKSDDNVNMYELAHKCKEWAWFEHSYQISSMFINLIFRTGKELSEAPQCQANMWNDNGEFIDYFDAKTEYETIFKACQWILDNQDK